jgi:xylulose-5-phosphate/fructose-6-phosphate phosphoketolase
LGYSLLHAYGAVFDNPDLLAACVIGDGEAETGPLEGSWKGNKFLNPVAMAPCFPSCTLNGYKIAGPTVDGRTSEAELMWRFRGEGYEPLVVEGDDPQTMHQLFAGALDACYQRSAAFSRRLGVTDSMRGLPGP